MARGEDVAGRAPMIAEAVVVTLFVVACIYLLVNVLWRVTE